MVKNSSLLRSRVHNALTFSEEARYDFEFLGTTLVGFEPGSHTQQTHQFVTRLHITRFLSALFDYVVRIIINLGGKTSAGSTVQSESSTFFPNITQLTENKDQVTVAQNQPTLSCVYRVLNGTIPT